MKHFKLKYKLFLGFSLVLVTFLIGFIFIGHELNVIYEDFEKIEEDMMILESLDLGSEAEALKKDVIEAILHGEMNVELALRNLYIVLIVASIISIILAITIQRSITKPVSEVIKISSDIANGNLNVKKLDEDRKDEIGQLSKVINEMAANLREMIVHINKIVSSITTQSNQIAKSTSEVKEASEQISSTMQELASGSEEQASSSNEIAEAMSVFIQNLKNSNEQGIKVAKNTQQALGMTNQGNELMEQSVKKMIFIDEMVKESVLKVKGLDKQTQEISKLVSVIKEIAEQTNLLALNAAIEAARAGEHGRGFSIVAEEVRKLAELVTLSVVDISGIVQRVQSDSKDVTTSLESGYGQVEEGRKQIEETGLTFKDMKDLIKGVANQINDITSSIREITDRGEEVNKSVENIASVSEESAAGIEQTSASSQQTSASMEELSLNATELSNLAESLNQLVRKFNI